MTLGQTTARLMLSAAILISVGCASRNGRSPQANSGDEMMSIHHQAQLLAAARQYEKEGKTADAARFYRQVLAADPQNSEAKQGLELVQSGRLRTETGHKEILAAAQPTSQPELKTRDQLTNRVAELEDQTAELLARLDSAERHGGPATRAARVTAITDALSRDRVLSYPSTEVADTAVAKSEAIDQKTLNLSVVTDGYAKAGSPVEPSALLEAEVRIIDADELAESFPDADQLPQTLTAMCQDANAAVLREVAKLDSDDPQVRMDGLRSLADQGTDAESALTPVSMLLGDDVELVRAYAAWATWELSGHAGLAVNSLTELLGSADPQVVQFAAYSLSRMGAAAQSALPALVRHLHSNDRLVRLHAAEAAVRIAPESQREFAIETLIMLTAERSPHIRSLALVALGAASDQPTTEVSTTLLSALHDSDAEVRATAALALGGFAHASESTIAQLRFVAESDDQNVRQAAATALDCIKQ